MSRLVVTFTFFLALSAAAAAAAGVEFDSVAAPSLQWTPLATDGSECDGQPAGSRVCADNCHQVLLCMGGSLDPIVVEQCAENSLCVPQEGACVNGTTECGPGPASNITCNALGMFPDPNDCTVYHICTVGRDESDVVECDNGWAYDPITTLCSKRLTDEVCTNLPIKCSRLGESNAFPGNANIYYICVADPDDSEKLYPELFRCEHGGTYNPDSYSCSDGSS